MPLINILLAAVIIAAGTLLGIGFNKRNQKTLHDLVSEIHTDTISHKQSKTREPTLQRLVRTTGWRVTEEQLGVIIVMIALFVVGILSLTLHSIILGAPIGLGLTVGGVFMLARSATLRRQRNIEKQLVGALTTIHSMLASGRPLDEAMERAGSRTKQPLRGELELVGKLWRAGTPIEQAIQEAAERLDNSEFKIFATAVTLQMKQGGDIVRLLIKIIEDVSGRISIRAKMRSQISEAKLVKLLVGAFPALIILMFATTDPTQITALTHGTGIIISLAAGILWVLGVGLSSLMVGRVEKQL